MNAPVSLPQPAALSRATAPYPGLRPFEPHEWDIFCGRERMTTEVISRLGDRNVVLVHGGSGCGKSSLVRAGVLPTIERDHLLAGRRIARAIMRPSEGPLIALADHLARLLGPPPEGNWADRLIFDKAIVDTIESAIAAAGYDSLCLVVDQFEEIFRWAREQGPAEVQILVDLLCRAGTGPCGRRLFVLVTMRSDYLGDCAQFAGLSALINACQYFLPNLDDRGLLRSIVEPARLFRGTIDDALVNRLRMQASNDAYPLPTLQHVLMRMADRVRVSGEKWSIGCDDLDAVSGTDGALSMHAEEVVARLLATGEAAAAVETAIDWIFRALIDVDATGRGSRRTCTVDRLIAVSGTDAERVEAILTAFSAPGVNLLIVTDPRGGGTGRTVEIAHEALIRHWRRMTGRDGWLQHELNDDLVWSALAITATNSEARLDAASLRDRARWFTTFLERPERARRYLLAPEGQADIVAEPEWRRVSKLMLNSIADDKRRRRLRTVLIWATVALATAALVIGFLSLSARRGEIAEEQKALEDQKIQIDSQATSVNAAAGQLTNELTRRDDGSDPASDTLTRQAAEALAPIFAATSGNAANEGYMWVGEQPDRLLVATNGASVRLDAVTAGQRFRSPYNIVLRAGPPLANNKLNDAKGVVKVGAIVEVLAPPRAYLASQGTQYWVNVRLVEPVAATLRVFPHFAIDEPKGIAGLTSAITAAGHRVERAQILPQAKGRAEIRYCHDADAIAARALGAAIAPQTSARKLSVNQLKSCPNTRLRTIELWLDRP